MSWLRASRVEAKAQRSQSSHFSLTFLSKLRRELWLLLALISLLGIYQTFIHFRFTNTAECWLSTVCFSDASKVLKYAMHFTSHSPKWILFFKTIISWLVNYIDFSFPGSSNYRFLNIGSYFLKYRIWKASIWKLSINKQKNTDNAANPFQVKKESLFRSIKCMYRYSRLFAVCCKA